MSNGFFGRIAVVALFASQMACMRSAPVNVYRMGEKVQAGPLIYNVFETKWVEKIGEDPQARTPTHRFLIVRLSVVNSGAETVSVQPLKLLDESGGIHQESMDGQDVPRWLGIVRSLKPADTLEGNVVFDLEPKTYKLRLDDGVDSGKVQMVELPLQFEANKPLGPNPLEMPK
jgi:hypothetical protein